MNSKTMFFYLKQNADKMEKLSTVPISSTSHDQLTILIKSGQKKIRKSTGRKKYNIIYITFLPKKFSK